MSVRVLAQAMGVAALLLLAPLALHSAHAQAPLAPSLELEPPQLNEQRTAFVLTALLKDATGEPLGGERITFFVDVDFESAGPMLIGSRTTDASGRAAIRFRPTWDGEQLLSARFEGNASHLPATVNRAMEVLGSNARYVEQPRGLERVRNWLPVTAGVVLLAVWISLGSISAWTVLGIVRAGSRVHSLD